MSIDTREYEHIPFQVMDKIVYRLVDRVVSYAVYAIEGIVNTIRFISSAGTYIFMLVFN